VFQHLRMAADTKLAALMGGKVFRYPKDPDVLKRLVRAILGDKREAVILDFFAGSGSTGQAVLEPNHEDDARHQVILATAAENGISREVCWERLHRLITGTTSAGESRPDGGPALGGALRFFTSDREYVEHTDTKDALKRQFRRRCTDLLRLREETATTKPSPPPGTPSSPAPDVCSASSTASAPALT
jgi:adenine-specific DNA-methyltransferase